MLITRKVAIEAAIGGADRWDGGANPERDRHIREAVDAAPVAKLVVIDHYGDGFDPTLFVVENHNASFTQHCNKAVGMWNDSDGDDEFVDFVLDVLKDAGYIIEELSYELYR